MHNAKSFRIAEHTINISFATNRQNGFHLLPSFEPFIAKGDNGGILFDDNNNGILLSVHVDDNTRPAAKDECQLIDKADTGNGITTIWQTADGYQFLIKDINGNDCCLLRTSPDFSRIRCALNGTNEMRSFGLNNAIMMMFAFRGSARDTLLIHASLVRNNGYGYAFIAKSGTGKSTHTALWLKYIDGCDLMNDDNPIIRIKDGKAFIYGSPWSGKTPCYRQTKARLGAITKIDRAKSNSIERLSPTVAFTQILPACSSMRLDQTVFRNTYNTVIKLIEASPNNFVLHCLPDEEAAWVCYNAIAIK